MGENVEVNGIISQAVLRRADLLGGEFASAQPFRHVVIDDFVDPHYCRELQAAFPSFDSGRARNELGEIGRKAVFPDLAALGPAYARFDRLLRGKAFRTWLGAVSGIPSLIYDPAYVGGGTHENLDGQDLDPHIDFNYHPATGMHRRLNLILFLNPEWQEDWGGALELHVDPWLPPEQNTVRRIVPLANRCVVFETTERSWHGFRRIQLPVDKRHLSRRSIAVYYYTRQRPRPEAAPAHGTLYVPRPLADHIQPGYTLREEDIDEMRVLLARRDRQIQFLYARELEYSRLAQSPTYRLARALAWPLRKLLRRK
jgi:Rps23 Pro-64 3,4-dihydroxylase Tpa1-like proline 4-hydroxylase